MRGRHNKVHIKILLTDSLSAKAILIFDCNSLWVLLYARVHTTMRIKLPDIHVIGHAWVILPYRF